MQVSLLINWTFALSILSFLYFRLIYQIVLAFDPKEVDSPSKVAVYNHWDTLNYIYGVVKIGHELIGQLKAVLEFEPGLYTHHQVVLH